MRAHFSFSPFFLLLPLGINERVEAVFFPSLLPVSKTIVGIFFHFLSLATDNRDALVGFILSPPSFSLFLSSLTG